MDGVHGALGFVVRLGTWNPRRVEQRETCVLEEDDEQARQARGVANNTGV